MDFELNEDQQAILEAVDRLLEQHAGPARAIELFADNAYDTGLQQALEESGFLNILNDMAASEEQLAGLEAALVVEAIARQAGVCSASTQSLVAAAIDPDIKGPVAICLQADREKPIPLRYGAHANTLIVLHDDDVEVIELHSGDIEPVKSNFGYPFGRLKNTNVSGSKLGPEAANKARLWWRLSLAIETVGTMEAALNHTTEYLKQRRQFGRAIGSFQAIQHRLALCAIKVEGSRWLCREAAFHNAQPEAAAAAASFAIAAADQVFSETHQMSGAIGFTREFDLHVWSMRLHALRQEMQGLGGHRRALVEARWG
jgi:alkylation response protein AidB-like acyl-CoA dehydrogenase